MTQNEVYFLEILKSTCLSKPLDLLPSLPGKYDEIVSLFTRNNLLPFVYPCLSELNKKGLFPDDYYLSIKKNTLSFMIQNTQTEHNLNSLLKQFLSNNLHPVLFKGYVLAQLYPVPLSRVSCDTDIFVPQCELDVATRLLQANNYLISEEGTKDKVTTLINEKQHHKIELHTALWENYTGKKIDILNSMRMTSPENLRNFLLNGLSVSTLGYNEHLIYQIFHIIKHLFFESISFRYLVDITLYVNKYIDLLDLTSFWNNIALLEYTDFTNILFQICHTYLGMTEKVFLKKPLVTKESEESLLLELMYQKSVKTDCVVSYQLLYIMTPYLTGNASCGDSKCSQFLKVLFPSPNGLADRYLYAKKCHFLLPIAWIHKGIDFLYRRVFRRTKSASMSDKLNGTHDKMNFLYSVGLLK